MTARAPAAAPEPSTVPSAAVVAKLTSLPPSVFDAIGGGGLATSMRVGERSALLTGASGKPVVVYVGGEFCPYCAAQRWSIVVALSRFGTWNGLSVSRSSSTDVFPNTPTFTFRGATYASDLIELSAVEGTDREGKPLASPDPLQLRSLGRFDPQGTIPYLSVADRYYVIGSGFSPDVLVRKTWDEIASAMRDPTTPIARSVIGNADQITAAICDVIPQPPALCASPSVRGLLPSP